MHALYAANTIYTKKKQQQTHSNGFINGNVFVVVVSFSFSFALYSFTHFVDQIIYSTDMIHVNDLALFIKPPTKQSQPSS